jgi:predicted ABC-type ATPase
VPSVIIIAGPNGAGKTTFANEYLSAEERNFEFVNADEIAREWTDENETGALRDVRAARLMLVRIGELVRARADFAIETTLASLSYASKIPAWRGLGYRVTLIYLRLPAVSDSLARVSKRVAAGGHSIPEQVIRRRFSKSASYFETIYKPLVDVWYLWESQEGRFVLLDSWKR